MQRVIDSPDRTPCRRRRYGPQCDVMITHGGNNTVGEAFTFGMRLATYEFTDLIENLVR